jgi:hypothetical protein
MMKMEMEMRRKKRSLQIREEWISIMHLKVSTRYSHMDSV